MQKTPLTLLTQVNRPTADLVSYPTTLDTIDCIFLPLCLFNPPLPFLTLPCNPPLVYLGWPCLTFVANGKLADQSLRWDQQPIPIQKYGSSEVLEDDTDSSSNFWRNSVPTASNNGIVGNPIKSKQCIAMSTLHITSSNLCQDVLLVTSKLYPHQSKYQLHVSHSYHYKYRGLSTDLSLLHGSLQ